MVASVKCLSPFMSLIGDTLLVCDFFRQCLLLPTVAIKRNKKSNKSAFSFTFNMTIYIVLVVCRVCLLADTRILRVLLSSNTH